MAPAAAPGCDCAHVAAGGQVVQAGRVVLGGDGAGLVLAVHQEAVRDDLEAKPAAYNHIK